MKALAAIFGFIWRALDSVRKVLHLIVLLLIFAIVGAILSPRIPIVPQSAALVIAPQGALVEQLSGDPLERAVAEVYGTGRAETLVRDVVDSIEAAKKDDRIKALVLDLGSMTGGGIAKLEEISAAVRDFRSTGKRVVAIGESYDQSQYYIAANADDIFLDPQGILLIEGYGYYRTFLKGAIDKLAVDVNIFKAGKFKSYTDQFSRSDMADTEKEESIAWLNSLWGQYQEAVNRARGVEAPVVGAYVNELAAAAREKNGDLAAVAVDRGLVTELKSRHEAEEYLKTLVGEDTDDHNYQGIYHWDYLSAVRASHALQIEGDRVGVVVASGEILDGEQPPGTIGSDSAVRLLRQARYDDSIKAVVLRIDSPGGSMQASEVIRREINALREAGKPVIASMSSMAASGGYYIAMDADEIWANPATLTGSIGVFAVFPTFERTLGKVGVSTDGIGTTPLAGALTVERTMKDEAKQILQLYIDHAYNTFIGHVASAREKPLEEIDAVAQGRVWAGNDAERIGLVDKLGSYKDALNAAAERAGLGKDYKVEYIEPPLGWRQALAVQTQAMAARITASLVPKDDLLISARKVLSPIETELARLARFSEPMQVYYYCACSAQ
ncbi:protease-4 [Povalibacter uvarum]|uniref:Protease-4 n=1 Tax=Povalibacter uvarum TaxID=732238 RepID=A0A841HGR2_9GAMM|nr:signal peptide peptidase SppA [Povalibacter uvarum]MBB6091488.1 protease-4 [Povalibacter uvarum]